MCAYLQNSKYMSHVVTYRVLSHDLRFHSNIVLKVLAEKTIGDALKSETPKTYMQIIQGLENDTP